MATVAAIDYLAHPQRHAAAAVCVLLGDEGLLKRLALDALRRDVLGDGDAEFSLARFDGRTAEVRDVLDEVATRALFGGRRLAVVEEADEFVSRHRAALEERVERPVGDGVLVLDVRAWPKTTRLYKRLDAAGLQIDCSPPPPARLPAFLTARARDGHGARLESAAAELLIELGGDDLGRLDQELAKLAAAAPPGGAITAALVEQLVGGWRTRTTWDMLDAAVEGRPREALAQVERLLSGGEHPVPLLAQMAASLRRFAAAARIVERAEGAGRRVALRQALIEAGVKPFFAEKAERQLRKLGRHRAGRLHRTLLQADLDLKGASELPPRLVIERLVAELARPQPAIASR